MATQAAIEAKIRKLEDIESIKSLQHKYFRCIDCKLFDELKECLTEDVKTDYDGGWTMQGRDEVMKLFREGVKGITCHQFHNPEIELTGDTTARGTWSFSDYLIYEDTGTGLRGAGIHYDEYVKIKGQWKISLASYTRLFEETFDRREDKSLKLTRAAKYPLKFPR